jgi:zinc protease
VEKGLTQEQFELARQFIINYSKLFVQTQNRRLGYKMDSEWYGTEMFQDKLEKELKKLTVEQVNAVIKKYLQSKNLKIAIVTKDAEGVKRALLEGAPSPIYYPTSKPAQDILDEDKIIEVYPLNINKDKIKIVTTDELF